MTLRQLNELPVAASKPALLAFCCRGQV